MPVYYHLTRVENVPKILERGLRPQPERYVGLRGAKAGKKVFLSGLPLGEVGDLVYGLEGSYAILAVDIPKGTKLQIDRVAWYQENFPESYFTKKSISPSRIKLVKVLPEEYLGEED